MRFGLTQRTKTEIKKIQDEYRFYSRMVKGKGFVDVCPYVVTLANGIKKDVWDLTESEILSLTKANVNEMTPNGPADKLRTTQSFEIVNCWKDKHKDVSADFIGEYFKLTESNGGAKKEIVRDLLNSIVGEKIEEATKYAKFEKGKDDNFTPVSSQEVMDVLREQERQMQASKQVNNNKTA